VNIFVLDTDHQKCAEYYVNRHCVKMVLETAQLLSGVHWMEGKSAPYKLSHKNHPCSIWARTCIENYKWLCQLGIAISKEYTYRYNKIHKSQNVIQWCINNQPNLPSNGSLTPFALAMPDYCKIGDTIESYREYYRKEKNDLAVWKNRPTPEWFTI
jgi:hypothetical protein